MSHETPTEAPAAAGESLTAILIDIGGGYGEYASPHVLVKAAFELMQKVLQRVASLVSARRTLPSDGVAAR
jgi:hypothetical protein